MHHNLYPRRINSVWVSFFLNHKKTKMNADNNDNALPYEYDSDESIVGERKPQNQTSLRLRHLALNARASGILNSYLAGLVHELGEIDTILEVTIAFASAIHNFQTIDDVESELKLQCI